MKRLALQTAGLGLLLLITVNGAVRLTGGTPAWISPFHVREKVLALGSLARHAPGHLLDDAPEDLRPLVAQRARRHGVPVDLALRIAAAESRFRPHCISHAGAMGVMQLMPDTARELGVEDPFDPVENVDGGVRYLARLWKRYRGDRARTVAAYNAGPGRVPRRGPLRLPGETRLYVQRVLR